MKQRRINEKCLELFPGLVKMEFWLFKHPEFLRESYMPPPILSRDLWEVNAVFKCQVSCVKLIGYNDVTRKEHESAL